jgi:cation diffusion facilitator family transporter
VIVMAGWVAVQSIHEIVTPHMAPRWWTLPLVAGIVVVKFSVFRQMREAEHAEHSTGLEVEAQHHWSDAITSLAAFVGIGIALIGGKGWESADDWAALAACGVIAFNGATMMSKALHDVMDTAVPEKFDREIRALALGVPGVNSLHRVRVRKSGLSYLVDIQIRVEGDLTVRAGHDIAHAVKDALIASAPHRITDVIVHVEPSDRP